MGWADMFHACGVKVGNDVGVSSMNSACRAMTPAARGFRIRDLDVIEFR
jgi:hypothetical protein